jgi:N6-adenosine-specific RNA methylase IME4
VAWGFTPKSELVWIKTRDHFALEDEGILPRATIHFGMGRQVRMSHEVCIIATRGRPPTLSRSIRSVFFAHFGGTHSRKPERFFRIVERLSPGPYVELFARRLREGWTTYGNELPGGAIHAEPSR